MTSALERLAGPGKSLTAEPSDAKEFEGLIVADLIAACSAVMEKVKSLKPLK